MRLDEIVSVLGKACPEALAAEWDNTGLQVGDADAEIERVIVALDPDLETLQRARDEGADLLVTHHPVYREPPAALVSSDPDAARLLLAARANLAVYAMHTNFDSAEGGVNDVLAARLGLEGTAVLSPQGSSKKVVVFVPQESVEKVAAAMSRAGGGRIGDYTDCSFRVSGTGAFTASVGTNPTEGKAGEFNTVAETRLEMTVPLERLAEVLAAMKEVHPYEEVAYDVYDVRDSRRDVGLGRVGTLHSKMTLAAFAGYCSERLEAETVKYAGDEEAPLSTVAVCGGSGGKLARAAKAAGADVLVAGDIGYHDAQRALAMGVAIVDAGHEGTEAPAVDALAHVVTTSLQAAGYSKSIGVYKKARGFWKPTGGTSG